MPDFKKYKRFFAFGCSMTSYWWPTWADIIAQEIPESYNYGQSGGGNTFIANQIIEAHTRWKFNKDDLVIVTWSGISREDRYKDGQWVTPGNIYSQNYFDDKFVMDWADSRGYLIRDLATITMCRGFLDNLEIDYHMLNMAPFYNIQWYKTKGKFDDYNDVISFYKETVDFLKPDILTAGCNGTWPQHPISQNGGQTFDYHPSTRMHLEYLNAVFPDVNWSRETLNFVSKYETIIKTSKRVEDIWLQWKPNKPIRL